jgi:hypothetical protein
MQPAFPFADVSTPVELLSTMITSRTIRRVLVRDFKTEKTFHHHHGRTSSGSCVAARGAQTRSRDLLAPAEHRDRTDG